MRLVIAPLTPDIQKDHLEQLAMADGRKIQEAFVHPRGFGFITADAETCVRLISALRDQDLCGHPLKITQAKGKYRRKRRERRKEEPQHDVERLRQLTTPSKAKALVSGIEGTKALLHTNSKFHDPRRVVAQSINEALDPVKAPKTVKNWVAEDPLEDLTLSGPGPDTKEVLDRLNREFKTKALLRGALKRKKGETKHAPNHHGITSEFIDTPVEKASKAKSTERAVEFLKKWLSNGPRLRADIFLDARRDEIPVSALPRALKQLSGHSYRGLWSLEPKPERPVDLLELLNLPTIQRMIHAEQLDTMLHNSKKVSEARMVELCGQQRKPAMAEVYEGYFYGKLCVFIYHSRKIGRIWTRNPDSTKDRLVHIQERAGTFWLLNTTTEDRRRLRKVKIGKWDNSAQAWIFQTKPDAKRVMLLISQVRREKWKKKRSKSAPE